MDCGMDVGRCLDIVGGVMRNIVARNESLEIGFVCPQI